MFKVSMPSWTDGEPAGSRKTRCTSQDELKCNDRQV
jgi:hypothetical protein